MAETAGGVLRHMEMQWKGCHPRNIRHLICSAHLRMAGMHGVGGEEGFLATALTYTSNVVDRNIGTFVGSMTVVVTIAVMSSHVQICVKP